jgi:hypothetical protein
MISDLRSKLSVYIGELLSAGRTVFTRQEAQHALGITQGAFLDAAERLQRRNALISPRRGFYVIVHSSLHGVRRHPVGTSMR